MTRSSGLRGLIARASVAGLGVLLGAPALPAEAAHPNALWHVVHDLCVPDMRITGHAAPCVKVDLADGYAVLKDLQGRTQLLLIPTRRIGGIESPELLAPDAPNYWREAWATRPLFERAAGRPVAAEDMALAVNSVGGRTQNQLHIHIDCIRLSFRQALDANPPQLSPEWRVFKGFAGDRYKVRLLAGDDLGDRDPFKLLAEDPEAAADMGGETLVMTAVTLPDGRAGLALLSARMNRYGRAMAAGEELLDHQCEVLQLPKTSSHF